MCIRDRVRVVRIYNSPLADDITTQDVEGIKPVSYTHLDVYKRQEVAIERQLNSWMFTGCFMAKCKSLSDIYLQT